MARAAVLGRLTWRTATVAGHRDETPTTRTLVLDVPGWPGHVAGQHVDVRLTAPDGYTATRAYSVASTAAAPGTDTGTGTDRIELTVGLVPDGEVSEYLTRALSPGDQVEIRGPVGGWFVWRPTQTEPVELMAGGTGLVPLMSMIRTRNAAGVRSPMHLLYSVRDPASVLYRDELAALARGGDVAVSFCFTRSAPPGSTRPPGRLDRRAIRELVAGPDKYPTCYVCGPTGFVETVADLLVGAGHDPARIRAERFGPSGGPS